MHARAQNSDACMKLYVNLQSKRCGIDSWTASRFLDAQIKIPSLALCWHGMALIQGRRHAVAVVRGTLSEPAAEYHRIFDLG